MKMENEKNNCSNCDLLKYEGSSFYYGRIGNVNR
jgi:hypothetical protein